MRFVPKMNGVECEEMLWKYSPESWGMHKKKGPDGDVTPRRNLSHIIGNDKNLSFRDS